MQYCSKRYMGKECALPDGWEKVGRFWGVVGRKNLPRSQVMEVKISREAFAKVRRTARRWFGIQRNDPTRSRGADPLHDGPLAVGQSARTRGNGSDGRSRWACVSAIAKRLPLAGRVKTFYPWILRTEWPPAICHAARSHSCRIRRARPLGLPVESYGEETR